MIATLTQTVNVFVVNKEVGNDIHFQLEPKLRRKSERVGREQLAVEGK
jgi:hypothetical protein